MIRYALIWLGFIITRYLTNLKCSWHITAILGSSRLENPQNLYDNNCAGVPFYTKLQAADRLERDSNRTLSKTALNFFSHFFLTVLYTHSRNNLNFSRKVCFSNNWALFAVHVWFLYNRAKVY